MNALEESFEIIGQHVMPHALILIETTVAPGTTEQVALPAVQEDLQTPGHRYGSSACSQL